MSAEPIEVFCVFCGAKPGEPCDTIDREPHLFRRRFAAQVKGKAEREQEREAL